MPRLNVIVLDQPGGLGTEYNYIMWADVPTARQRFYANAALKSAWVDATAADNTALQNGSVVEKSALLRVVPATSLAQVEAFLQQQWTAYQNGVTNYNAWLHYGSTWDGATWIVTTGG
jgi:hypothetical protein